MNIEEIKKIVRQEMEDSSPSVKEVLKLNDRLKWWGNKCKEQEKEIKRLNTIIRVAIEYLEKNTYEKSDNECGYTYDWNVRDLYDILKGSDINE